MSLEILHNRAEHTHENEQFRRCALELQAVFSQRNWDGILIGNPFNDNFHRFRADAILCYNYGLILIDFKDYQGTIYLPPNDEEFQNTKWYSESNSDKSRIEIKAGSRFINPFRQLKAYREAFYEIIEKNIYLNGSINASRVAIANIFSGPVEVENNIPGSLRYYKLVQESELATFLYDFASENKFTQEIANALKVIFPASKWEEIGLQIPVSTKEENIQEIEKEVEIELGDFLQDEKSGVFVLESMDVQSRDNWMKYLVAEATNFGIPQIELWGHSARICKKITDRTRTEVNSIYKAIYGGNNQINNEEEDEKEENAESKLLEKIPIKSNEYIDENALIIIHEAHLVNRSLNQSELLRFGSGRLLEDIFKFLNLENSNRKVICIGDPYSLSFGKNEDAALNRNTLSELFDGTIKHYRNTLEEINTNGISNLRYSIANSIENTIFNQLKYNWNKDNLFQINKAEIEIKLKKWFSQPKVSEPKEAVLMYSKKDAKTTNLWIKNNCLNNGKSLAKGDLLVANNNVTIPDDTGFNQPKKVINGMYFSLNEIKVTNNVKVKISQSPIPINLNFININVKCLSLQGTPETDLWILENYFISDDGLSNNEKIAFRVFVNNRLNDFKKEFPFNDSEEFRNLKQDVDYINLTKEEKEAIEIIANEYNLSKDKKTKITTTDKVRKQLLPRYYSKFNRRLSNVLREKDALINAVLINYGWALTVHKGLGSSFNETIVNTDQGESKGINNAEYFRWLYTAITTTENCVFVVNPKEINPFQECEFKDESNNMNQNNNTTNSLLKFQNYELKHISSEKLEGVTNVNVIGVIDLITNQLELKGYVFENVQKKSDYLTKIIFSIPQIVDKKCVLNIDNKGERDQFAISNVRIDKLENDDKSMIEELIKNLFTSDANQSQDITIDSLNDFRKEIYSKWSNTLKDNNFNLKLEKSHNNHDIFIAANGIDKIKFQVWYGTSVSQKTKGFINSIIVTEKSKNSLGDDLKSWLL
ncbi:nuclease-related domain-containing protein [Flavobacterium psychrophilum]|uniref:nuclease-related domain-containing protein n=1 Tax=Flavobacterium psychrophilum TaxID=96345 RepID=UPI000B7C4A61|nr:NERD domain-containing protein [Flavobacterium psychrophilum]SNB34111.1 conserved hypothetical protein [Flavobacterium psychrophilum]